MRNIFNENKDRRLIIATFASNIHRLQQVIDLAAEFKRKVAFSGRSMINVAECAARIGELHLDRSQIVDIEKVKNVDDKDLVILTTGSQGEPMSALTRMAADEFSKVKLGYNDTVILSAHPIPGNERMVYNVINNVYRHGARVIYESLAELHVSGHACRDELSLLHALLKPQYFIPVHGEHRHLQKHAELAVSMGEMPSHIIITDIGDCVYVSPRTFKIGEQVAAGSLLVTKTAEIACAVTGGTTLIDEDTLALADGSLLTLVFTKGVSDKEVRLNANMGGAKDALNADLLRDYDLSFTLKNGKVAFKDGANLLAKKTTAVYSSLGAVALTIDLSDLGIVKGETAEPAYAFELNLGGTVKAYSVNAAREITELTLGEEELQTIVAATCTVDGVQAKALMNGDNVVLWYGIVFVKGEHAFPAEGGLCTVCKEVTGWKKENVQVGKTDNSQAFTTVHGDNKAYNPDASQRYSVIVPGQKVVAEGKVTSITTYNYNGVAALLYEGSTFKEGDHIRIDNWVNNGPDPQTDFTLNNFRVQKTTCTLNGKTSINWETVKAIKANGNIKITWDWSDTSKILVRYDVSGIDTLGEYVQVWTFSAKEGTTLAAKYSIGILPDSGSFTGTITATASKDVVAAEDCNPVKHTHVYAPETDRCECGELNPTHTHNYIDNYCKCGALDPQHEHAFAKGICSICKMVCYHKDQTGANCALCGAELKTGLSFDNVGPGGIGWAYDVPGTLTKGKSMIIYGTHTGDVTEQWQSLIWECKEGYTGRSDAYGWSFGDAKLGNTPVITSTLIGNEGLEVANDWAIFKEIARKDNAWRLEFTWTQEGKLNVLLSYSSLAGKYAGYTYNCLYTFDISRTTQTEWTFHIGGEKVSNITITAVDLPAGDNTNPVE